MLQDISFCSHFFSNPHHEMQLRLCLKHLKLLHLDDLDEQVISLFKMCVELGKNVERRSGIGDLKKRLHNS